VKGLAEGNREKALMLLPLNVLTDWARRIKSLKQHIDATRRTDTYRNKKQTAGRSGRSTLAQGRWEGKRQASGLPHARRYTTQFRAMDHVEIDGYFNIRLGSGGPQPGRAGVSLAWRGSR